VHSAFACSVLLVLLTVSIVEAQHLRTVHASTVSSPPPSSSYSVQMNTYTYIVITTTYTVDMQCSKSRIQSKVQ
jgi:hypothetical protein